MDFYLYSSAIAEHESYPGVVDILYCHSIREIISDNSVVNIYSMINIKTNLARIVRNMATK